MGQFSIKYELVRFKSSDDKDFQDSLRIYRSSTPHEQKTNSSEIVYWVDNQREFGIGELFFFGIKANGVVVGYAELAYVKKERILIIDYINLDQNYRSNNNFYTFYALIINYINNESIDYDYITKEILCRYNETHIHKEDVSLYELENFKVVNGLYIQPQLERNNIESIKESLIMLYTRAGLCPVLKKDAYLHIVEVIYDYYYCWDKPFLNNGECVLSKKRAETNLTAINKSITNDAVTLNGYPFKFSSSTNGTEIPAKNRNNFVLAIIFLVIFVALVLSVLYFLSQYGYDTKAVVSIGIPLALCFILALVVLDKDNLKILKKTSILQIFGLLK